MKHYNILLINFFLDSHQGGRQLRKVENDNFQSSWNFRIDIRKQGVAECSLTQWLMIFGGRLLKYHPNRILKLAQQYRSQCLQAWGLLLYLVDSFCWQPFWLQTLLFAIESNSCQRLPCFSTPPSEVAVLSVLFNQNLSRCPLLGKVTSLDLLTCTVINSEHEDLF